LLKRLLKKLEEYKMNEYDLVIRNGLCLINDKFIKANIGIEKGIIEYVGKENIKGETLIDASDKLVMPGLFNAHTHVAMCIFRGLAEDLPLQSWLKDKIWKIESKLKPRDVYYGALLGIVEMIKSGTTAFYDMYFHMDEVAKAVSESKIRAILSYGMADRWDESRAKTELKIGTEFLRKWNNRSNGKIKVIFGPHALYTCSLDFLRQVKTAAKKYNTLVHMHVSETKDEVNFVLEKYKKRPIQLLDDINFLDSNTILAHAVWITDDEIMLLKKREVSIVHNPVSNLKLTSGISEVYKMINIGINVCLGTDGGASNNSYNLFEEIKMTLLLQKYITCKADVLKAIDALKMATKNGYKAYKLKGGNIKKGFLADLILINKKSISLVPMYNPVYSIAYSGYCDVTHSIIGGELVMCNREILTVDEEKIISKAENIANDILNRLE